MQPPFPQRLELPAQLGLVLIEAVENMAARVKEAHRAAQRVKRGRTLRPGKETPLWNALIAEIRPHLRTRGSQARLGRILGLPRQRVNAFITGRTQMPDAERALQVLAWLMLVRQGKEPGVLPSAVLAAGKSVVT